ncbi:MAG: preprotein translocase subunit SecG [Clostridia bacterium]|nr:preprotein translocase subunit SecG [Clostridia bacterium]
MGWIDWTLAIATVIVGVVLTIVVMLQSSKDGQSSVTGSNTFYGSNKSKTLDGILSKYTVVLAIVFCILCFATTFSIIK